VVPITAAAPAARAKPVLVAVQAPPPEHTSVNNSTRVLDGLIRKTSRSAGRPWAMSTPTTSIPRMAASFAMVRVEIVTLPALGPILLGTSVLV
jgi:hypothetical protein